MEESVQFTDDALETRKSNAGINLGRGISDESGKSVTRNSKE